MEIPFLVQLLKSRILSSTSSQLDDTFLGALLKNILGLKPILLLGTTGNLAFETRISTSFWRIVTFLPLAEGGTAKFGSTPGVGMTILIGFKWLMVLFFFFFGLEGFWGQPQGPNFPSP